MLTDVGEVVFSMDGSRLITVTEGDDSSVASVMDRSISDDTTFRPLAKRQAEPERRGVANPHWFGDS